MDENEMVAVTLVGGPMDGTRQPVDWAAVYEDPEPGLDMVPDSSAKAPESIPWARVLYTADPAGPPDVWHWRSWVP